MKKIISLKILIVVLLSLLLSNTPKSSSAQQVSVSFQMFYDDLSPYGQWVNDPYYGYVWVPNAGGDFMPYNSGGHWEMTTYGNMWVSDYPWGWAPFHYGRWAQDETYGWLWIPGNTWGPAWVCWREGGGYYGWAPLGPGIYTDISLYNAPEAWWVFCPREHFLEPRYHDYYYGARVSPFFHNTTIIKNTYVNHNVTYYSGPRREEIQQVRKQPVTVYAVNRGGSRGAEKVSGNSISVYGPRVSRTTNTAARPAPAKVEASKHPINNNSFIKDNKNVRLPAPRTNNTSGNRAAATPNAGHVPINRPTQPAAKQQAPANNNRANKAPRNNNSNAAPANRQQPKPAPAPRQNAAPRQQNQNMNRPAPKQNATPRQNMNRPAPPQNAAPRPQNQNMNRPAPQPHNNPAPAPRPQAPPRNNPAPAPRPQAPPQMNRPEPPANHPEPQMERPKEGPKWY